VTHITLSIPLNTGVVGGIVTQTPLRLPIDLTFQDFYSRVCAHMDLEPLEACLGYKLPGDHKSDVPFRLSMEEELRAAMGKAINLIKRAHTHEVVMEIFNMVRLLIPLVQRCSPTYSPRNQLGRLQRLLVVARSMAQQPLLAQRPRK